MSRKGPDTFDSNELSNREKFPDESEAQSSYAATSGSSTSEPKDDQAKAPSKKKRRHREPKQKEVDKVPDDQKKEYFVVQELLATEQSFLSKNARLMQAYPYVENHPQFNDFTGMFRALNGLLLSCEEIDNTGKAFFAVLNANGQFENGELKSDYNLEFNDDLKEKFNAHLQALTQATVLLSRYNIEKSALEHNPAAKVAWVNIENQLNSIIKNEDKLTFESLIVGPMQRIARYPLQFKELKDSRGNSHRVSPVDEVLHMSLERAALVNNMNYEQEILAKLKNTNTVDEWRAFIEGEGNQRIAHNQGIRTKIKNGAKIDLVPIVEKLNDQIKTEKSRKQKRRLNQFKKQLFLLDVTLRDRLRERQTTKTQNPISSSSLTSDPEEFLNRLVIMNVQREYNIIQKETKSRIRRMSLFRNRSRKNQIRELQNKIRSLSDNFNYYIYNGKSAESALKLQENLNEFLAHVEDLIPRLQRSSSLKVVAEKIKNDLQESIQSLPTEPNRRVFSRLTDMPQRPILTSRVTSMVKEVVEPEQGNPKPPRPTRRSR